MSADIAEEAVEPARPESGEAKVEYQITSKPSKGINTYHKLIDVDQSTYLLTLLTMSRSFLLSISNVRVGSNLLPGLPRQLMDDIEDEKNSDDIKMPHSTLIRCFAESDSRLKGLSLAIGERSTCLIESENSLASCTLASRLSKKFNLNRPVYVVNNIEIPRDQIDVSDFMCKFNMKMFQFVGAKFKVDVTVSKTDL